MTNIDIKEHVKRAIERAWPIFERDHPHLAAAMDPDLLVAQAARSIADDAEFQEALSSATSTGLLASAVADLIPALVTRWLRSLF